MTITRKQIESETDYAELREIGKSFREDGQTINLGAKASVLKKDLLDIFDNYYSEEEEELENIDEEAEELDVEEEPEVNEDAEELAEEIIEEAKEESADPYDNSKLYITKVEYKDWESGWEYNPATDTPKPLPEKLSHGLENALKSKRITRFIE